MTEDDRTALLRMAADLFSAQNGQAVLEDLIRTYHDRLSATLEEQVAEIPHPFRSYYIEGQRSVVLTLRAIVESVNAGDV